MSKYESVPKTTYDCSECECEVPRVTIHKCPMGIPVCDSIMIENGIPEKFFGRYYLKRRSDDGNDTE